MASKLITGSIILLIAGAASCGTYLLLNNAAYLRSSAPVIASAQPTTMAVIKLTQPVTDSAALAAQYLTAHADQLISWPGKLGQVSGTYWAVASTVGDTKAPQGPRIFISADNKIAVTLPEPPYTVSVQHAIDSFSGK